MTDDTNRAAAARVLPLLRYAGPAAAAARVGVGVAALAWPSVPGRAWVGAPAGDLGTQVFGRALGARDLALGLAALAAARMAPADPRPAAACYAAGALSDALDTAVTAAAWPRLPRTTRWLVLASSAAAAIAGAAGTLAALRE